MQPIPYLQVENVSKSVGDKLLFDSISFGINKGDKIALVARNGIGKSTLLDILMGKQESDTGRVTWRKDIKVHYLCQSPETNEDIQWMSGGQQKWKAIEEVLSDEPDLLILDEPTNHLDLGHVEKLEETLQKNRCTLLMVTHDRYFLDAVCNTIIEMDQHQLYTYSGNYSYYLEKRTERIEQQQAIIDKARNLYRTELEWMRRMPQARAHKAQYRIEHFYEIEQKSKGKIQENDVQLSIQSGYIGNKIFEAKEVSKRFPRRDGKPEKVILNGFSYIFSRYEKLGIIGANGTGKSTFLKLLLNEEIPDSGRFDIGTTVRFGYYRQTGLPFEKGKKVIDLVRDVAETIEMGNGERLTASQFLQQFLFSPQQQYDYVEKLSGGERQRLHLCMVLIQNPNFLILDEPTNDLDIPTLQVLEAYLRDFKGCLIVVSHDRFFMDRVVDHLFVFEGEGHIKDFPGNYTQYRDAVKQLTANKSYEPEKKKTYNSKTTDETNRPKRLTYKEKQELIMIEERIPQLEREKKELEEALSGGLHEAEEIVKTSERYQKVCKELDETELRWLELQE